MTSRRGLHPQLSLPRTPCTQAQQIAKSEVRSICHHVIFFLCGQSYK